MKASDLLTSKQCAERLRVHHSTIARWVRRGILPAWRIGGVIRIRWSQVEELLKREIPSSGSSTDESGPNKPAARPS